MKNKGGYLLLESIISLFLISTLVLMLCSLLLLCINSKINLEDKIELQQQASEMSRHIEEVIGNSMGIISIKPVKNTQNSDFTDVISIKCRYKDDILMTNTGIKDKEISLKENLDKLFINTVNRYGVSEAGGYEVGDYIDNLLIDISKDNKCAKIKLKLSKNKQTYETEFKVYMRNFKGEKI